MGEEGLLAVVGSWKGKEGLVGFINVYAPHDLAVKSLLWEKISTIINSIDVAWCIFGDFNEVRNVDERKNSGFNRRGVDLFNNFITGDELIDIPLGGKRFTRVSDDGLKFNDSECEKVVADCWKKQVFSVKADCIFRDKLKNVKEGLKEWSKVKFERNNKDIKDLKNEATKWELVAKSRDLDVAKLDRWKEARKEWLEKDKRNNEMKKQKSRVKWVLEGDENSKFFHSCIRSNYRKSNLNGLVVDEVWCDDPGSIKEKAFDFFNSSFRESNNSKPVLVNGNFKTISSEDREELECFIRYILDGGLFANETVEFLKKKKRKAFLLKIDFKKAYDSVNWNFIHHTLIQMGFRDKWSAEGLNITICEAVLNGIFKGVSVGRDEAPISHLQYAYDTLIFGDWNMSNSKNIMRILECIKLSYGLKINPNKTKVYGIGVGIEEVTSLAQRMRCAIGLLPFTYLGLLVGCSMKKYLLGMLWSKNSKKD
ncbi:RNA-directed DNA polymerase, eukaryota [Tanacetum coccineum]